LFFRRAINKTPPPKGAMTRAGRLSVYSAASGKKLKRLFSAARFRVILQADRNTPSFL
jgi:hypothetical protein